MSTHIWGMKWRKLFLELTPTSRELDTIGSCLAAIKAAVKKDRLEDMATVEVISVGAYEKGTLLRGTSRLDVLFSFSSSLNKTNLDNYLHMIKKSMENNFPLLSEKEVYIDAPRGCVILFTTTGVTVTIYATTMTGDKAASEEAGFMTVEEAEAHAKYVKTQSFTFKDLVRLAKHWRDCHCVFSSSEYSLSSPLIELIMANAISRHRDKETPPSTIFKSFLKLVTNYNKLGLISKSTVKSLGKMPVVQDVGNPLRNLAMPAHYWTEVSDQAQQLIMQIENPNPAMGMNTSGLKKNDLIRIVRSLSTHLEAGEDLSLSARLLQQLVALEDRVEELENRLRTTNFAAVAPGASVPSSVVSTPVHPSSALTGSTLLTVPAPPAKMRRRGHHSTPQLDSAPPSPQVTSTTTPESNRRMQQLEEITHSLATYCTPTNHQKKNQVDVSFVGPFDQRVYKKEFIFGGLAWEIQLYPVGKDEAERGYASVFFKLKSSHIHPPHVVYTKFEIASQLLNSTLHESFTGGSRFGFPKAFDKKKLRVGRLDFKLKISFPTPVSATTEKLLSDKVKSKLYI